MGNQLKKDAKRAKRKKQQAREHQRMLEISSKSEKKHFRDLMSSTFGSLASSLVRSGDVTAETDLFKSLANDDIFDEIQWRVLAQISAQCDIPDEDRSKMPIPPRYYVALESGQIAANFISPASILKCGESMIEASKRILDSYPPETKARFICVIFGIPMDPSAEHFAILLGASGDMEVFLITGGEWSRLGHGAAGLGMIDAISRFSLEAVETGLDKDPIDQAARLWIDENQTLAAVAPSYKAATNAVTTSCGPLAAYLISRMEDLVLNKCMENEDIASVLSLTESDLEEAKRAQADLRKQLNKATVELSSAKAMLAARRPATVVASAPSKTRPIQDRMGDIFLGISG